MGKQAKVFHEYATAISTLQLKVIKLRKQDRPQIRRRGRVFADLIRVDPLDPYYLWSIVSFH